MLTHKPSLWPMYFLVSALLLSWSAAIGLASQEPLPVVPGGTLGPFQHGTYPSKGDRTHAGVDILAPCGSPVYPLAEGRVVDAIRAPSDPNFDSLGYMVILEHPAAKAFYTLYLHLQGPPEVGEGNWVSRTTRMGKVGRTGAADACHVHFEVRYFKDRFSPVWRNIYGPGDQRTAEHFKTQWEEPLAFWQMLRAKTSAASGGEHAPAGGATSQEAPRPIQEDFDLAGQAGELARAGRFDEALQTLQKVAHPYARAEALAAIGLAYADARRPDRAVPLLTDALRITRNLQNPISRIELLSYIARAFWKAGRRDQASELFQEAVRTVGSLNDQATRAGQFSIVMRNYLDIGEVSKAKEILTLWAHAAGGIKDSSLRAQHFLALEEDRAEFEKRTKRTIALAYDPADKAWALIGLAWKQLESGRKVDASRILVDALAATRTMGEVPVKARNLQIIAMYFVMAEQREKGIAVASEALQIARPIGEPTAKASLLDGIASVYVKAGKVDVALPLLAEAVQLAQRIPDASERNQRLADIVLRYAEAEAYEQAVQVANMVEETRRKPSLFSYINVKKQTTAQGYAEAGQYERAINLANTIEDVNSRTSVLGQIRGVEQRHEQEAQERWIQKFRSRVDVWLGSSEQYAELTANPFRWKGKIVGFMGTFVSMESESSAVFGLGDTLNLAILRGVPSARFTRSGETALIAGRVQGMARVTLPIVGTAGVPELTLTALEAPSPPKR